MIRAVLVLLAIAVAAQTPRATLTGRVVTADGERPIAGARVVFNESDALMGGRTDADGRFVVANVGANARYNLAVVAPGFLRTVFGYEPLLGGTPFVFAPGETTASVVLRMHRGAVIAGRIVDEAGEPVARTRVNAFRLSGGPGNEVLSRSASNMGVALAPIPSAETDDRGQFRIINVEPGAYIVGAMDRTVVTFAPAATTVAQAAAVTVAMDEERSDVNIRMRSAASGTVEGVVTFPAGGAAGPSQLFVGLWSEPANPLVAPLNQRLDASGRFRFDDVPEGAYTLYVNPDLRPNYPQAWARASVTVTANRTTEQNLVLRPGARVAGRMTGPFHSSMAVGLHSLWSEPFATRIAGYAGSSFALSVPPGRYKWAQSLNFAGPGPLVLRAYLGDDEVTDLPMTVTETTSIENMRLVVEQEAVVTGTVRDADGRPTSAGAVIIASTDRRHWTEASSRIRLVRADVRGVFRARGLLAGRYRVSYVTRLSTGHIWEPSFLGALRGVEVAVAAGAVATVDVGGR